MSQSADNQTKGNTLLIYNPCAGKNSKRPGLSEIIALLQPVFGELTVQETKHAGHAKELAQTLGGSYDTVICCGGDGTLNEAINGLLSAGVSPKIGYIPIGSTNDLATSIGIPSDLHQVTQLLASGETHGYDIGRFNDSYFTYCASFGPGVSVSYSTPQGMKNALGYSAYMINGFLFQVIPTLKQVKPKHIKITYDGQVLEDDFYFGAVSNSYSVAGIFKFNKADVLFNDGKLEVMLVRRLHRATQIFPMLHKMRRRNYDGDTLIFLHAHEIRFEFSEPTPWTLDGEFGGDVSDANICALQNAVQICCDGKQGYLEQSAEKQQEEIH